MKHTLKLKALTEEYDEDYESRNDDFERYARHFLKTNVCRLTKDVWTIKTDCSYDEIYEFLEDHGWGFFEFISLDDFTNPIQLYDYVWEQRGNMEKSIPSIHEIFADHLLASQLKNASVQKSKTAPKFSDMVKSARYGVSKTDLSAPIGDAHMTARFEVGKTYGIGNDYDVLITGRTTKTVSCVFRGRTYAKKVIEFAHRWDREKDDFVETDIEMIRFAGDIYVKASQLVG